MIKIKNTKEINWNDYEFVKEYKTYNLYIYKGLYRTCFLKWDIEQHRAYNPLDERGAIPYTHNALPYRGGKMPRINPKM